MSRMTGLQIWVIHCVVVPFIKRKYRGKWIENRWWTKFGMCSVWDTRPIYRQPWSEHWHHTYFRTDCLHYEEGPVEYMPSITLGVTWTRGLKSAELLAVEFWVSSRTINPTQLWCGLNIKSRGNTCSFQSFFFVFLKFWPETVHQNS